MQYAEEEFEAVRAAYEGADHLGSGSLLEAIRDYFENSMFDCAYALACHGADVQREDDPFAFMDKTWTQVYLETFRRAFYDEAGAALYGTSFIFKDPDMLKCVTAGLLLDLNDRPVEEQRTRQLPTNTTLQ